MSEHEHIWLEWREPGDPEPMVACAVCKRSKEAVELEQQLAQARALLEEVGEIEGPAEQVGDYTVCFFCKGDEEASYEPPPYTHTLKHEPDCVWLKIRAFLAQE